MEANGSTATDIQWGDVLKKLENIRELRDRATTKGEAESAAAALTRMLTKYNLSMAEFEMRTKAEIGAGHGMIHDVFSRENTASWRGDLLNYIAMNNNCRAVFLPGSKNTIMVGKKEQIAIVTDLYSEFVALAETMARRASREESNHWDIYCHGIRRWKTGYLTGFASGLGDAMREARMNAINEHEGGSALVLVQDQKLQDAVDELIGATKSMKAKRVNAAGFRVGHGDGKGALTKRIG